MTSMVSVKVFSSQPRARVRVSLSLRYTGSVGLQLVLGGVSNVRARA